jgi:outer membrane protein OmpA-like peptidoglycan-associated protein
MKIDLTVILGKDLRELCPANLTDLLWFFQMALIAAMMILNFTTFALAQDREQQIGVPKRPLPKANIKGQIFHLEDQRFVPNASISVMKSGSEESYSETIADSNGMYQLPIPFDEQVEVKAESEELFYDSYNLLLKSDGDNKILLHDFHIPSTLSLRVNYPTNEFKNPYPNVLDSNGAETSQKWEDAMNDLASNLTRFSTRISKLIIIGHSDDIGNTQSNKTLGLKRAKFIEDELVKRDIEVGLIEIKSAGKSELLAQRTGEDVEPWRKRCRRAELSKVLKTMK